MTGYSIAQVTEGSYHADLWWPLNSAPSVSRDGSRVVFATAIEPDRPGSVLALYDAGVGGPPRTLTVERGGEDRPLVGGPFQIAADGQKIIFQSSAWYTVDEERGIYLFDIDTGRIRLVVPDTRPCYPGGNYRPGLPGETAYRNFRPSIADDGRTIAFVRKYYECRDTTGRWWPVSEQLNIAFDDGERLRGDAILHVPALDVNHHGHGIKSLRISGDGTSIVFYAGGEVIDKNGAGPSNLSMPPYEVIVHGITDPGTCNVYCFVVRMLTPGRYTVHVIPDPESQSEPLVVAHPESSNVQSFRTGRMLHSRPGINHSGSRIALHAGFVMQSEKTGVYVADAFTPQSPMPATFPVATFGDRPGAVPGDRVLSAGAVPDISTDGTELAYYRRYARFPEGYESGLGDVEAGPHCPRVDMDEVETRRLPVGGATRVIESFDAYVLARYTSGLGLSLSGDASHIAFISMADITGDNLDQSHELFYASRRDD